jgi:hypothetical protein
MKDENSMDKVEISIKSKKFIRRTDLTPDIRLYIAYIALMAQQLNLWGKISDLAREFHISRMFVYMLASTLEQNSVIMFGDRRVGQAIEDKLSIRYILSLRMEGQSSIGAISSIMKRFEIENSSTGYISQILNNIGSLLPDTLSVQDDEIQLAVFLSDELFSKQTPILVTVEPRSSAILRIELSDTRKADDWKNHWKLIEDNGYHAVYLVSDEGTALCKAHKEALGDTLRQPDTYHAIAHRLGLHVKQLEKRACTAIEQEYKRYDKLDSAVNDNVINKRIEQYEAACNKAMEKIECYESYDYLYQCLIKELHLFDDNGKLRNRQEAEGNIESALDMIDTLGIGYITKAVKKVRRTLPELLNYFDVARPIVQGLADLSIEEELISILCLAWQWQKDVVKAKTVQARQYCSRQVQSYIDIAAECLQNDYELMKNFVWEELDKIVQSSALVECINSIIRPYLNTSRNHVNQELLNLIMFYHNHRRYKDGKRKGKTPNELLTGNKQDKDWIDLLFEVVEEKDPSLFNSLR